MGVDPARRIRAATITMSVDHPVMITTEEYVQPFNVIGDALEMVTKRYKLVEMSDTETDREEAAYYATRNQMQVK
jgi:hypothetical protein